MSHFILFATRPTRQWQSLTAACGHLVQVTKKDKNKQPKFEPTTWGLPFVSCWSFNFCRADLQLQSGAQCQLSTICPNGHVLMWVPIPIYS